MKSVFYVLVMIALMSGYAGIVTAAEKAPRIAVDLSDGSHLLGIPSIHEIPFRTHFAQMTIPLSKILLIEQQSANDSFSLTLQNNDKISGIIEIEEFDFETVFGSIQLQLEFIDRIRILLPGGEGDGKKAE